MRQRFCHLLRFIVAVLTMAALGLASCGGPGPTPMPGPIPEPSPLPPTDTLILALPAAFRFEVTLRTPDAKNEPATVITGQYRDGAWSQSSRRGEEASEDLIIAPVEASGPPQTFTRPVSETVWTRWPGEGFDAAYGLSSPFSVLRLHPLADQRAVGETATLPDVAGPLTKTQTVFAAETVQRLLRAGVSQVATSPEKRSVLESQLAPFALSQTITYWVGADQQVYQAVATLLTADLAGRPTPWLEVVWRFFDYDDPGIAVAAPSLFTDAADLSPAVLPSPTAPLEIALDPRTTLRIRSFSMPGVPLENATVTVYPARKRQVLGATTGPDAQFALPVGKYDVEVKAGSAEERLKDVVVIAESVASQDVVFNFGTLALTVTQNGATPKVDIVVYPAGERQDFADYRSENPVAIPLRAGTYDVEVALPDFSASQVFPGIEIRAGETVSHTLDLGE